MPELREVFEMVRKQTEPPKNAWEEQERRQRRRLRNRKLSAIGLVAGIGIAAAVVVTSLSGPPSRSHPAGLPTGTPTSTSTPLPAAGLLKPGTYTLDRTTVPPANSPGFDSIRITFSVPSGWDAWDLGILTPGETEGVTFWKVSTVPADPCHWQRGGPKVGPTVDDLATALANQSRRHATTPRDVTLAGYAGKHLTLTVPAHIEYGLDEFSSCDQGYFVSWNEPPSSAFERYHQGPGQVDELWILDIHGFRLVIDATYWLNTPAQDLAEIHRIVKSVRIERG
jgi:hypothetical protein